MIESNTPPMGAVPDDSVNTPPTSSLVAPRAYFYSARDNAFYLSDELPLYETAGNLPPDLVSVEEEVFRVFALALPPVGKMRTPDEAGLPCWVDEPPLPDEVVGARNVEKRGVLLRAAADEIAPLQDAVDLDLATAEEATRLRAWKVYRVALNRLENQEGYPLLVDWPELPA